MLRCKAVYTPPASNEEAILFAFPATKNLSTCMEVECLKIQTALIFSHFPFSLNEIHEHNFSPSGKLPCLMVDGKVYAGRDVIQQASQRGLDIDSFLSPTQKSSMNAFKSQVETKLGFCLDLELWYDTHFNSITLFQRGISYPWPLNLIIPRFERNQKIKEMMAVKPIYGQAQVCLDGLSLLLGDQQYFYGSRPTTLDAAVFAYIHIILSLMSKSSSDSKLRKLVLQHDNLVQYSRRLWQNWYARVDSVAASLQSSNKKGQKFSLYASETREAEPTKTTRLDQEPCQNYGSCGTQLCTCLPGFGSNDCSQRTCGSLGDSNRPILTTGNCTCTNGFSGINCNICTNDNSCSYLPTSALGASNVCNTSPLAWLDKHYTSYDLLSAAFPYPATATFYKDNINLNAIATLWLDNNPQFSCNASTCTQSQQDTKTLWSCSNLQCKCNKGSKMCGGSMIDLTSQVNGAKGGMSFNCNSNDCVLNFGFLSALFPSGVSLTQCVFGECASEYAKPSVAQSDSFSGLDASGIAAISLVCGFGFVCLLLLGYALIQKQKKQNLPIRPDIPGVRLSYSKLSYVIGDKTILSEVSGAVYPGQVLAIMGPSGAGKTTCLDMLAMKNKGGVALGSILVNGDEMDQKTFTAISGFVDQEDVHLPNLTVREVLMFSASLRLPESMSHKHKVNRVEAIILQLGLAKVADSRVGDTLTRGISGGEKRRLSIGVELVTNPAILFLDEPTSGLDSYNALQVIQALSNLATTQRKTIIFSIHQPNSSIFAKFDQLLLLAKGKTAYFGPASGAIGFCKSKNMPCPDDVHIADHILDFAMDISSRASDVTGSDIGYGSEIELRQRKRASVGSYVESGHDSVIILRQSISSFTFDPNDLTGSSSFTQLQCVFARSWKVFWRSPLLFWSHLGLSVVLGTFIGLLYFRSDPTFGGIQNRLGAVFFTQSLLGFAGLSAIDSLNKDKLLFVRERSNGFYGAFPYFLSKVLFDVLPLRILPGFIMGTISFYLIGFSSDPIVFCKYIIIMVIFSANCGLYCLMIGCLINDMSTSTLVASISLLFQMLFAGILVNQVSIPAYLGWLQYLSFFKYAYEACVADISATLNLSDQISGVKFVVPASSVLSKFGLDVNAYDRDMAVTVGLFFGFLSIIWILIKFNIRERK
ncbi:hypothetical protein HDV01_005643 [Terramyces sp. JEL0728]|nr:hypothetical protein HDV01_005643 [Terramyces sp. JEL0728]